MTALRLTRLCGCGRRRHCSGTRAARHGAEALAMLRVCQGRSPMCLAVERSLRETEHELAVSGAASSAAGEEEEDAP